MIEIQVGDHGTRFEFTFKDETGGTVDLTSATEVEAIFTKPDRSRLTKALTVEGGETATYVAEEDMLDQRGRWRVQGRITTPLGTWSTRPRSFRVYPNL